MPMKTLISKIKSFKAKIFSNKRNVSIDELVSYPEDTLGFHLGCFLFSNSCDPNPVPEKEDIYRLLLTRESSNKEDIAMHYYLFGNGDNSLRTLFIIVTGAVLYPLCIKYFYNKYRDGRNAFRFYDLDHFRMLHLPLQKIKDAFLIR